MNHHTAAQKGEGGGWHYVSLNRRGGYPLGYCAEHAPHPTEAEARACYGLYLRANVTLDGQLSRWSDCDECGAPTKTTANIRGDGYASAALCTEHLTHDLAVKHLHLEGSAGDSWES
jgi:hypothetical protein